jgi:hypothetical protein
LKLIKILALEVVEILEVESMVPDIKMLWPNQSPEPTAVAAAVAIHAPNRRWLSFGR